MASKLAEQATTTRDLARRAKRLAGTLTAPEDADRLHRYAQELEAQAIDLERRAREGD